ncbi:MAG: hypothetical protein N2204_08775, partial [Anaerolineae bacterium]|nr:hypothetical protein [Anaerolineae bacterium]
MTAIAREAEPETRLLLLATPDVAAHDQCTIRKLPQAFGIPGAFGQDGFSVLFDGDPVISCLLYTS